MAEESWRYRSWTAIVVAASWQGLVSALVGALVALPFGDPAPSWAFFAPGALGAAWAVPIHVAVDRRAVVVRNRLRRYVVPLDEVVVVEHDGRVSGWGAEVRMRTTARRRSIRLDALATADASVADALDLVIREQRARR